MIVRSILFPVQPSSPRNPLPRATLFPCTLRRKSDQEGHTAHSIALLTVGGFLVICFGLWERFGARHPLIPFSLLKNRTVIAAFVIAVVHPAAGGVIGSYLCVLSLVATWYQTPG